MPSMFSRAKKWLVPGVAILLVLLADGWSRQPPERFSAERVTLDAERANPESGHAYWISLRRIAPDLISDKDGVSPIVLLEDGVELEGHALHADVRSRGGGLYSHWGSAILFSTRDGSDPRVNGRRYEVRLPPRIPWWHRGAQVALLALAGLLLLWWLHGVLGGSRLRTAVWATGGAVVLAVLALGGALLSSPARELRAIRVAVAGSATVPERQRAESGKPRTRHLLRDGPNLAFATDAPSPAAPRPRAIALHPSEGVAQDDGYVELGDGTILRNTERLDIAASDLELMVLELDVARGGSLILRLSSTEDLDPMSTASLSFPVAAARGPQTIRFRRPALGETSRVRHIAVEGERGGGEPPIVRLGSLRYTLRLDAFAAQHAGFDSVELGGSLRPALWQSVAGRSSFRWPAGSGSLLKLAVGTLAESPAASIDFAVSAVLRDGRRTVLESGAIHPREGWRELAVTLPEDAEELVLEGERLPLRSALLWSGARLIDRSRPPRRMVMILADTLRADALGSYGHPGDPTPALDRLARQGARFERAFSQTHWTRPSMASIMTGCYVVATGVETLDHRLPDAYETLAERLADGGFTTVGIVTNANAGPGAGLDQGFDRIRLMGSLTRQQANQTDRLIAEVVLPTLDQLDEDDVFLYLHLMEAHGPYGPPEPPDADPWLPAGGPPVPRDRILDRPWNLQPTAAQRVALYDYDVRSMDRALGEFFAHLDRRWASPEGASPIVALVSDHGEYLGERGQWGHRFADLYPENVQVPLIIRAPGRIEPGTEYPDPVEVRHLGATLLALVDLAPRLESGAAQSLLPLLEATVEPASPAFAVSTAKDQDRSGFSLFGQRYGYVARLVEDDSRIAIFADPELDRRLNASWRQPMLERVFLGIRRSYLESQSEVQERLWAGMEDVPRTIDPGELERLKALGYID